MSAILPTAIDPDNVDEIANFNIVVSLQGPVESFIPEQPFHTVFLDWDVGTTPSDMDQSDRVKHYYAMYREITVHIRNLHETLFGEGDA